MDLTLLQLQLGQNQLKLLPAKVLGSFGPYRKLKSQARNTITHRLRITSARGGAGGGASSVLYVIIVGRTFEQLFKRETFES